MAAAYGNVQIYGRDIKKKQHNEVQMTKDPLIESDTAAAKKKFCWTAKLEQFIRTNRNRMTARETEQFPNLKWKKEDQPNTKNDDAIVK